MPINLVELSAGQYAVYSGRDRVGQLDLGPDSYTLSIQKKHEAHVRPIVRRILPYNLREVVTNPMTMAAKDRKSSAKETRDDSSPDAAAPSGSTCLHTLTIEPATAKKIRSLCKDVFFMEGKKKVGKEFFGRLHVVPAPDGRLLLKYDEHKVVSGDKDGIDGFDDRITYHTHPYPTYIDFDAKYAWPSKTDYTSILDTLATGLGVAHIVVAVEGVYVVSLGDHFCDHPEQLKTIIRSKGDDYKRLLFKYDREYPYVKKDKRTSITTPDEFIRHANAQKVNGKQVLINQFLPWDSDLTFRIRSASTTAGCKLK